MATEFAVVPSYQLNADAHTILNGGSRSQSVFEGFSELITKGVPATLVAAGNELSNIPATVGNLVFGDNTYNITKTRDAMMALDSDLARYYDDHELGVDTAGFIVSQFVPGMAATKVTRAGQLVLREAASTGRFGAGMADAFKLQQPLREKYLAQAISEIGDTGNVFKLTESNMLKAFAAGVGQEALEGAAWTMAVNATMHNSPILDDRDASDLMWDVATGAWMGGLIGGAFSGIGSVWRVKGAAKAAEQELLPWTVSGLGGAPEKSLSTSDKILKLQQQIDAIPDVPADFKYYERAGRTAQQTKEALQTEIRRLTGELTGGDQALAHITSRIMGVNPFEKNVANFIESTQIARVTKSTKTERLINKLIAERTDNGLVALDDSLDDISKHRVSYVNTRTMQVLEGAPSKSVLNLADHGDVIVRRSTVQAGRLVYKQGKDFDAMKVKDQLEAEARYVFMESAKKLDQGKVTLISENDLPLMFKALNEGNANVNVGTRMISSLDELRSVIKEKQQEIAAALVKDGGKSLEEAARIVNADARVLDRTVQNEELWDYRKWTRDTYSPSLGADPNMMPAHMKILTTRSGATDAVDGHVLEGMQIIAQKEKLYKQRAAKTTAAALSEILPSAAGMKSKAIGTEAGSTFLAAEGGAYGSWSSFFAYIGQRTANLIRKRQEAVGETLNPLLHKLANDTDAAIEWSVLNETLRGKVQGYRLADDGMSLILQKGANEATEILDEIPIKSPVVRELVENHISLNSARRRHISAVHADNGYPDRYLEDVFYPIPRDPKDTPFFAFVVDDSIEGRGHSKMIYAKDGETLEKMRNEIMSDPQLRERGIKVITKKEAEDYYESVGKFEFERTLSDNYINNALARKGKTQSFLPLTDPKRIVDSTLNWHMQRESQFVRTMVEHNYASEFDTLRQYAAGPMNAATSRAGYSGAQAFAESTVNNPAANLIKLALNISKIDEYPVWSPINRFLDAGFSRVYNAVTTAFSGATSSAHLNEVNAALKNAGAKDLVVDAALYEAMNGKVPRGKLTELVSKANSLLSMLALRIDPFNAMNNAVGHAVLLGPEVNYIVKNVLAGNENAVGELARLAKVKVPGTADTVLSPSKLIGNRILKFGSDAEGREWFKKHGFISDAVDQYRTAADDIAVSLNTGSNQKMEEAFQKIKNLGAGAEKWSGNKFAEEFNRYVAAGVMKDITDIAVKNGLMNEQQALAYINTFVNRTQGNYLAAQRPGLFQGPLGQAIGLFQTYQFNLLQQVFRYIGEGDKKTALLMMGLQGGIYGLNGLPAFNAINTHIIGSAGGNINHTTGYDAAMSLGGKEAGEWLLYGTLSNGLSLFHPDLKTNIYNRGDINPRHLTLVPTDPSKIPIYQATEKLFLNTKEGFTKVAMGADVWSTFLRGVEQNGVSRPLAGLAQVLEGMGNENGKVIAMSQQGRMTAAHDLWSLQSLMRITGAKPLDEAIVNDQMFRVNTWRARDVERRKLLGEGIKNTLAGGNVPSQEQLDEFAYQYAKAGGKQSEYANFMANAYTQVNVSKAEELRTKLGAPGNQSMQYIMQGYAE